MKQWSLFFISIGCVLIMLSYMMPNPILLVISGIAVIAFGVYELKKTKGAKRK